MCAAQRPIQERQGRERLGMRLDAGPRQRTRRSSSGRSIGTLIGNIRYVAQFLEYWLMRYPQRTSLTDLRATPHQVHDHYFGVRRFVVWLQRVEHPLGPTRLADRLFDPNIAARPPRQSQTPQKWIPESVLRQLDAKIQHLDSMYVPVVTILRASGWRISDVVSLCYDSCVRHEDDKWRLVGDIQKARVLGHRVPITEEVALAIRAHVEVVKASLTAAENPHHYLFPAVTPQRRGQPVAGTSVLHAIHKFVQKHQLLGDDGKPFHLKTHAFAIRKPLS